MTDRDLDSDGVRLVRAAKAFMEVFGYFPSYDKWRSVESHLTWIKRWAGGIECDFPKASEVNKHFGKWTDFRQCVESSALGPDPDIVDALYPHAMRGTHKVRKGGQVEHHPMWIEEDHQSDPPESRPGVGRDAPDPRVERERTNRFDRPPRALPSDPDVTLNQVRKAVYHTHFTIEDRIKEHFEALNERLDKIERDIATGARRLQHIESTTAMLLQVRRAAAEAIEREERERPPYWGTSLARTRARAGNQESEDAARALS